jgi:hypothetical protein
LAALVQYVSPVNLIQVRLDGQFCQTKPVIVRQWSVAKRGDQFAAKIGQVGISRHPAEDLDCDHLNAPMSVGVFSQFLGSLSRLLDHAAAYAELRKIGPSILLNARLYPNMYNLTRQVGEAIRHAVVASALLAGVEPPVFSETEPDIAELTARIAIAVDFLQKLRPDQFDGADEKEVVFTFRNGSGRKFTGQSLLLTFSVPQFFFHVTTAYDILRHCGVDLVKKDFLGTPDRASQDCRN